MSRMSRLPGRSIKNFGWALQRHQLWLTEQYLMSREISMFEEVVRRYYYREIQAILTGPTTRFRTCNWLAGSLLVFLFVCAVAASLTGSTVAFALSAAAAVVPLIILVGNLLLGPTCRTTLYTAAAEVELHSLGRRRSAEKAIALLLPFVEAAQRDVVSARDASETATAPESGVAMDAPGPTAPPEPDPSGP
jgi:hypothetical protein